MIANLSKASHSIRPGRTRRRVRVSSSISELYPRLEEAFDALKWLLAHRPEKGKLIDDIHWIYKQRGNHELNIPALAAIYTFDANAVHLITVLVRLPLL